MLVGAAILVALDQDLVAARDQQAGYRIGVEIVVDGAADGVAAPRVAAGADADPEPLRVLRERAEAPRRTWQLVAAASLVATVVAGGVTYLATRDTSTTQPTALADRNAEGDGGTTSLAPAAAAPTAGSNAQGLEKQAIEASGNVTDLGSFGDLRTDAELNRVRAAFSAPAPGGAATSQSPTAADNGSAGAPVLSELGARPCAGELPEGLVVAVGRARFGTRSAIVVKTMQPDGSVSLDAVVADPCEVRPLD